MGKKNATQCVTVTGGGEVKALWKLCGSFGAPRHSRNADVQALCGLSVKGGGSFHIKPYLRALRARANLNIKAQKIRFIG